jgi:hypothetical protein
MKYLDPTNSFSFTRLVQVIKRTYTLNKRTWGTGALVIIGALLLFWFFPVLFGRQPWHQFISGNLIQPALFFYTAAGLFLTSAVFYELHSPDTAFLTLTLPATSFEKIASAWLITSILFTLVSALIYIALVVILHGFSMVYIGADVPFSLYQLKTSEVGQTIMSYFGYQSIFLLGAIIFKKNNFLKTLLAMVVFMIGAFIITGFLFLIIGGETLAGSYTVQFSANALFNTLYPIINLLIVVVILSISYIRLKNKQVA